MKNVFALFTLASLALLTGACHRGFELNPHSTDCYTDAIGYTHCETHYWFSDGSDEGVTRDIVTDLAQAEQTLLESQARLFARKFSLSEEQGLKIAKTIHDYDALQNRTDRDVADFAQRLYGVDPHRIVSAAGAAQAGDNTQLNDLVTEAARHFETTPENMKTIVKALHGKMLEQQGIRF